MTQNYLRMRSLDFVQIHYEEHQKDECYPFATHYFNSSLTDYFENSVIADLVPKLKSDLISVCSWRLKQKRDSLFQLRDKSLTKEKICNADFDVAILTPRSPSHRMLFMASMYHPGIWDSAFSELKVFLNTIGVRVPEEVKHAVYENHFIATKGLYHEYITTCLLPVMSYMRSDNNNIFNMDAGYEKRKKGIEGQKEIDAVKAKLGHAWTIAPFILERLFSIWIDDKKFKVINL